VLCLTITMREREYWLECVDVNKTRKEISRVRLLDIQVKICVTI
jgi:hypothetical protein